MRLIRYRTKAPFLSQLPLRICRMSTLSTKKTPPVPRPSASLVIVNSRNEVLLVHRNPRASAFAGVHVFPGGNYDAKQDHSMQVTAIRETFEESGLLLASSQDGSAPTLNDATLDEARTQIHSQQMLFQTFLLQHSLKADTASLLPFTQWITPANAPRRFHTHFFITFLQSTVSSGFSQGRKQDRIPTPDGGQEVIAARFIHPSDALSEFREGKVTFMPPQFYILHALASILHGPTNTSEQRHKIETLSRGLFGKMVLNPRRLDGPVDETGRYFLTYEGDETRGGSPGRLHRVLVKAGKAGVTVDISLMRNFDIYSEIEEKAFESPEISKM